MLGRSLDALAKEQTMVQTREEPFEKFDGASPCSPSTMNHALTDSPGHDRREFRPGNCAIDERTRNISIIMLSGHWRIRQGHRA
jgi:hypothetical protein